jgi:hypothetical protein
VTPIQHTNGILYGDTLLGGDINNTGVFYSLNLGLKPFVSLLPMSGKVGATVEISGRDSREPRPSHLTGLLRSNSLSCQTRI